MIQALVANKMPEEAYTELSPMIERVLKNKVLYEWDDVRDGAQRVPATLGAKPACCTRLFNRSKHGASKNK